MDWKICKFLVIYKLSGYSFPVSPCVFATCSTYNYPICSSSLAITYADASPDCCSVVQSWKQMGKTTTITRAQQHTNATSCCSMSGVTCSRSSVIKIDWNNKTLTGSIPTTIGNLENLKEL